MCFIPDRDPVIDLLFDCGIPRKSDVDRKTLGGSLDAINLKESVQSRQDDRKEDTHQGDDDQRFQDGIAFPLLSVPLKESRKSTHKTHYWTSCQEVILTVPAHGFGGCTQS